VGTCPRSGELHPGRHLALGAPVGLLGQHHGVLVQLRARRQCRDQCRHERVPHQHDRLVDIAPWLLGDHHGADQGHPDDGRWIGRDQAARQIAAVRLAGHGPAAVRDELPHRGLDDGEDVVGALDARRRDRPAHPGQVQVHPAPA
jgi:hypothetical protein